MVNPILPKLMILPMVNWAADRAVVCRRTPITERTARMYMLGLRPQRREVSPETSVPMNFPMKGVETMTDWSVEVKAYCPLEFTEPKSSRKATLSVQESWKGLHGMT